MELNYNTKNEPLIPGAKRGRWRSGGIESADRDFALVRPKALQRDSNRCQQCGMEMDGMHVHHKNDDHSVNDLKNLETREDLCHAVSHVGHLGKSGAMVHLDISQRDLSHLYRTIAIAINMGGEWAKKANKIHEALMLARGPVQMLFGTSNPGDFGNALMSLTDDEYSKRRVPLEGVRVIFKPSSLSGFGTRAAKKTPTTDLWERIADEQLSAGIKNDANGKTSGTGNTGNDASRSDGRRNNTDNRSRSGYDGSSRDGGSRDDFVRANRESDDEKPFIPQRIPPQQIPEISDIEVSSVTDPDF